LEQETLSFGQVLLGAGVLFFVPLFAKICSVFGVLARYLFSFMQLQKKCDSKSVGFTFNSSFS